MLGPRRWKGIAAAGNGRADSLLLNNNAKTYFAPMLPAPGIRGLYTNAAGLFALRIRFFGGASYPSRREGKRGGLGEREPSERCDRTRQ